MRRVLSFLLLPILFFSSGCDFVYRLLDKEGAEEKALVGDVLPYERNPTIEQVQSLLSIYGYNPGKVDGVIGLRTRNAIAKFQEDNRLKVTRFVDRATWKTLNRFRNTGFLTEGQLNVGKIQEILQKSGAKVDVDGQMGPNTIRVIKEFQEKHQLKPDGKIGYRTLLALQKYI